MSEADRQVANECTQGSQGRHAAATTIGGLNECALDGQGGHGPQENQGCTVSLFNVN